MCVSQMWTCDGVNDCGDNSDEAHCKNHNQCSAPGQFRLVFKVFWKIKKLIWDPFSPGWPRRRYSFMSTWFSNISLFWLFIADVTLENVFLNIGSVTLKMIAEMEAMKCNVQTLLVMIRKTSSSVPMANASTSNF